MRIDPEDFKDIRMPRCSWDYEDISDSDHWFLLADAYLDICHFTLSSMIGKNIDDTFHHCKVVVSLFEHSVELFLKELLFKRKNKFRHIIGSMKYTSSLSNYIRARNLSLMVKSMNLSNQCRKLP